MLIITKSVLFFGTILLFGYCFTTFFIKEKRFFVAVPIMILIGINAYVFFLNIFSYFFPIQIMIWLLPVLMGLGAVLFLGFFSKRNKERFSDENLLPKQTKFLFLMAGLISILSGVVALRTLELDDLMLTHIPLAATISEGNFPVMDPSSPNHPLAYHYAPDLLAAAMYRFAGLPLWLSYDIQTAIFSGLTFLVGFLLAFYLVKRYKAGLIAALLMLYGGGITWLYAIYGIKPLWEKFVLGQEVYAPFKFLSSIDIPQLNANFSYGMYSHSQVLGFPIMLFVIYLFFRILHGEKRWKFFSVLAGISFGYLALSIETNFILLGFVLFLFLLCVLLNNFGWIKDNFLSLPVGRNVSLAIIIILSIGGLLALVQGGALTHWGLRNEPFEPTFKFWQIRFSEKVSSIFSWEFLIEFGLVFLLLPFVLVFYRKNKEILFLLVLGISALLIPFFVHFPVRPWEIRRFILLASPVLSFVFGLYLWGVVERYNIRIYLKRLSLVSIFLLISYGLLMQFVYLIYPIGATITRQFNKPLFAKTNEPKLIDKKAYSWIDANTTIKDRFSPYDEDFISFTGRFTPGPFQFAVFEDQVKEYQKIVESCDPNAIKILGINYFYISPKFPIQNYQIKCGQTLDLKLVYSDNIGNDWRKIYKIEFGE